MSHAARGPELEDDIQDIRELDRLRGEARQMISDGLEALTHCELPSWWEGPGPADLEAKFKRKRDRSRGNWVDAEDEPCDYLAAATAVLCAHRVGARDKCYEAKGNESLRPSVYWRCAESLLTGYQVDKEIEKKGVKQPTSVGVLQSARVLQALLCSPRTALTPAAFHAYIYTTAELVAADYQSGNYTVGGARANLDAQPSAFVTAECTRAISSCARALEKTALLLQAFVDFFQDCHELIERSDVEPSESVGDQKGRLRVYYPNEWTNCEFRRLALYYRTTFLELARDSAFLLPEETINLLGEITPEDRPTLSKTDRVELPRNIREFLVGRPQQAGVPQVKGAIACLKETVILAENMLDKGGADLKAMFGSGADDARGEESGSNDPGPSSRANQSFFSAIKGLLPQDSRFSKALEEVNKQIDELEQDLISESPDAEREAIRNAAETVKRTTTLRTKLCNQAQEMRKYFAPAKEFLRTVLDRDLAKKDSGTIDVGELASAAAALAIIDLSGATRRASLEQAADLIRAHIGVDGSFSTTSHLQSQRDGAYSLSLMGSEVIRAYAQLLGELHRDIEPDAVEAMMRYFHVNAHQWEERLENDDDLEGVLKNAGQKRTPRAWTTDHPVLPRRAYRWTSALSVLALDHVERMLDSRINRRVYRHFTVRQPEDFSIPTLQKLTYPDYGLASIDADSSELAESKYFGSLPMGESIAFYMERARAHIAGAPGFRGEYSAGAFSFLLFGPPGTGKTSFFESLAKTCRVPMVEVTPSDIVIEGEALIERRTRIVFEALSKLTRTVILFDEFDPILRSRELEQNSRRSVFSFVTPGMLPKLKTLNQKAESQNLVYALNTNRIGTLDDAAIRSGRFDFKVGVFPPDYVSRFGAVCRHVLEHWEELKKKCEDDLIDEDAAVKKIISIVVQSQGIGMTAFTSEGNLRPIKGNRFAKDYFPTGSMMRSFFKAPDDPQEGGLMGYPYERGAVDANPNTQRNGQGDYYDLESRIWAWILASDKQAEDTAKMFIH